MISMDPLKREVSGSRPPGDPFRESVLAEPDEITPEAFQAKLRTWLVLLRLAQDREGA
jgi:hypothetical protein